MDANEWQPIETAPKDGTPVLLLSTDSIIYEGWWDERVQNFYKSQEGWASYDPENAQGDWVALVRCQHEGRCDRRLYCGETPRRWMPKPREPEGYRDEIMYTVISERAVEAVNNDLYNKWLELNLRTGRTNPLPVYSPPSEDIPKRL